MAQTLQSIPFRANLSTANEVPPLDLVATGSATVWVHATRSASGVITEAYVDFSVDYNFPGPITITGLHVHRGIRGQNGPVVLNSGVATGEPADATGKAGIVRQSMRLNSEAAISSINDMIANPNNFYVNFHTAADPGGAIRGQVLATTATTVMTQLSPANEVPPIVGLAASGFAAVTALTGRDTTGAVVSSEVTFDVAYTGFPAGTEFTGLHIHTGAAGVNGPVTINSTLAGTVDVASNGTGTLRFVNRINGPNAATVAALAGLESSPAGFYVNLHTRVNPGGAIRGQTLAVDAANFGVNQSPANEVPPVNLNATSTANFNLRALRGADGVPLAGLATFSVNFRFPETVTFTGLHLHTGVAGQNGPVVINSNLGGTADSLTAATGFGNIYRTAIITNAAVIAAALQNPSAHYLNLHSAVHPGGAVRAQLAGAFTTLPVIERVEAVVGGGTVRSDGLIRIVGSNLAPSTSGTANGGIAVLSLVGTSVRVGGADAPIRSVSPTAIVVQIPRNVGLGILPVATFPVIVTTVNGASNVANLVLTVSGN